MTYQEQLESEKWKEKRKEIILRDKCCCKKCGNSKIIENATKITVTPKITDEYLAFQFFHNGEKHFRMFYYSRNIINSSFISSLRYALDVYISEFESIINIYAIRRFKLDFEKCINETKQRILQLGEQPIHPSRQGRKGIFYRKIALEMLTSELQWYKDLQNSYQDENSWLVIPGLNVHHKFYVKNRMAWDYDDAALTTLCADCHKDLHQNEEVLQYDEYGNVVRKLTVCSRCNGAGILPQYMHVQNGICFRCWGVQYDELITPNVL